MRRLATLGLVVAMLGSVSAAAASHSGPVDAVLIKDIWPGPIGSEPLDLTVFNGELYFQATDGFAVSRELWKTDGTTLGTRLVVDISPGSTFPTELAPFNGELYFSADDGIAGRELWKTDGTPEGTVLVADIAPGTTGSGQNYPNSSDPAALTEFNGELYFSADDGVNGRELWKTDGTAAGTVLVKDVDPAIIYPRSGPPTPASSDPGELTVANGELFFAATGLHGGRELYKTDGTDAGTVLVKGFEGLGNPGHLTEFQGQLIFAASTYQHGRELWKSDGTQAGTVLIKDINAYTRYENTEGSYPAWLTVLNGELYFQAFDRAYGEELAGAELWKTDGTEAGTVLVKDITPGRYWAYRPLNSNPTYLTAFQGEIYFIVQATISPASWELWKSDGTEAGTVYVAHLPQTSREQPQHLIALGDDLLFTADDGSTGRELWKLDVGRGPLQLGLGLVPLGDDHHLISASCTGGTDPDPDLSRLRINPTGDAPVDVEDGQLVEWIQNRNNKVDDQGDVVRIEAKKLTLDARCEGTSGETADARTQFDEPPSTGPLAIAYTDTAPADGQFNPSADVIISALVDANGSGFPDAGDLIVMGRHPTAYTAPYAPAGFSVSSHRVASATVDIGASAVSITASDADGNVFYWISDPGVVEQWSESGPGGANATILTDGVTAGGEQIEIHPASPSGPTGSGRPDAVNTTDDGFLDVQISLP